MEGNTQWVGLGYYTYNPIINSSVNNGDSNYKITKNNIEFIVSKRCLSFDLFKPLVNEPSESLVTHYPTSKNIIFLKID